jgi:hypothetical protein
MRRSVFNFVSNSKQKGGALAGRYGTKGPSSPNLVRKALISKFLFLGRSVVVLLIAGVMAIVLWRRRVRRDAVAVRASA